MSTTTTTATVQATAEIHSDIMHSYHFNLMSMEGEKLGVYSIVRKKDQNCYICPLCETVVIPFAADDLDQNLDKIKRIVQIHLLHFCGNHEEPPAVRHIRL